MIVILIMGKKSRLYIALSIVYVSITVVLLASYYLPDASNMAFSSILEEGRFDQVPVTIQADPVLAEVTVSASVMEGKLSGDLDYYSWMVVITLMGGQFLLAFGLLYHREWAQKFMMLIIAASLLHLMPYASQHLTFDPTVFQQEASVLK